MIEIDKKTEEPQNPLFWIAAAKKGALLFLGLLAVWGGGLWCIDKVNFIPYLERLEWLRIKEVTVTATWPLTPVEVRALLPALDGKNLFLVKPHELLRRLENNPWVEGATIKKEYPNHLLIDVRTRSSQAILLQGSVAYFLDSKGKTIEKLSPLLLKGLDLPVVSLEPIPSLTAQWDLAEMLQVLESLQHSLFPEQRISEMSLGIPPYFHLYLSSTNRTEVLLSRENWKAQVSSLLLLLKHPPSPLRQPQRINLIFPKKAIVSSLLSN